MSNRASGTALAPAENQTAAGFNLGSLAIPALILAVTFLGYGWVLDLDHLGWDAWPLIASSSCTSPTDFLGLFTSEFMGGLFPDGSFYRPLTSLSFALDGLLWDTRAAGFHHTDLLLLALNALVVFRLGRRFATEPSRPLATAAALCAAILFLLHPLQVELLPAAPRRADALCLLFSLLALQRATRPVGVGPVGASPVGGWPLALLVTFAVLSKETGLLALPLAALGVHLHSTPVTHSKHSKHGGERLRQTFRTLTPTLTLVLVALAARTAILSGLGGYGDSAPGRGAASGLSALAELPTRLGQYAALVLYPQPLFANPTPALCISLLALGLALATLLCLRPREPGKRTAIPLLLIWLAGAALLNSTAGRVSWWYGLQFLPPLVLLLAQFIERAGSTWRNGGRLFPITLSLVTVLCALPQVSRSGALVEYTEWQRGSDATREWLGRAQAALAPARQGTRLTLVDMPAGVIPAQTGPAVHSAALLAPYSLVAWLEVHFPGRTFRLAERQGAMLDAGPQGTGRLPIHIEFSRRLVP